MKTEIGSVVCGQHWTMTRSSGVGWVRKRTERTDSCSPETWSSLQRPLDSSYVLSPYRRRPGIRRKALVSGWLTGGRTRRAYTPAGLPSPPLLSGCPLISTHLFSPFGVPRSSPAPSSLRGRHRPLAPPPPSSPPWGADSPGCHVSLMTSPGSLGLSQSARGSPSEVLASESAGRGAGRGKRGRWESGEWGGRQALKYACTGSAGLRGKLSPGYRAAP